MLQPQDGMQIPTCMRCGSERVDRLPLFVYVKRKVRIKLERDGDEVRRCLHVRLGHLPSGVMPGVGWLRLREVRQVTCREWRRDRRNGEREKAKDKKTCDTGAMCGSNHGTTRDNKNPASLEDASFSWRIGISGAIPSSASFPRRVTFQTFLLMSTGSPTIAKERLSRQVEGPSGEARALGTLPTCAYVLLDIAPFLLDQCGWR